MNYLIRLEHTNPIISARELTRRRSDAALLAARRMAYDALYCLALLDRPVAHRVMGDLAKGVAPSQVLVIKFADYLLTISATGGYRRKTRART